jgi:hypothetical protein
MPPHLVLDGTSTGNAPSDSISNPSSGTRNNASQAMYFDDSPDREACQDRIEVGRVVAGDDDRTGFGDVLESVVFD